MPTPLRSDAITAGVQRAPNRAMLRAVGFGDADFGKPIIGIAKATLPRNRAPTFPPLAKIFWPH